MANHAWPIGFIFKQSVGIVVFGWIGCFGVIADDTPKKTTQKPHARFTSSDESSLRKAVYEKGFETTTVFPTKGLTGKTSLVVPAIVTELHKQNRLATLQTLFDIAKGGRPEDALLAAGYVVALEKSPIAAAVFAHSPVRIVDREGADADTSFRISFVRETGGLVEAARKQIEGK
jgi:hypothetical protein